MTPAPVPPPAVEQAALPLVALVLGILGFCIPPLFLVAIVLAVISLAKGHEPAYAGRKVMAIIVLVLGLAYVPVVGILAAIAIPNFIRYTAKAKQSECKANLKAAYVGQRALHAERDVYSLSPQEVGFSPERSRYVYRFDADGSLEGAGAAPSHPEAPPVAQLEAGIPADVREGLGLHGECPDCDVTMACAGNIDGDPTIDVWTVSTGDRSIRGVEVPAGQVYHHVDDVTE